MTAFAAAVELGYRYLETDAQLTRDGVLLAFHDETLDRVTDLSGRVSELTLAEIKRADAAYRFRPEPGPGFPLRGRGIEIPTLDELFEAWPLARFNIDAKTDPVVRPLASLIERRGVVSRVCVGSFIDPRLARFRHLTRHRVCTSMGRSAVAAARLASIAGWMPRLGAGCVQVPVEQWAVRIVDRAFVRAAHRGGLPVHVWTIDDAAEMRRLLDLGVDGIMTDRPTVLRQVLLERGSWPDGPAQVTSGAR